MYSLVTAHGFDEGMDGTTVLEVAAQADSEVVEASEFAAYGKQVGHGLRGVAVSAVACVDDGDTAELAGNAWSALFVVPHGDDVGECADYAYCVGHCLALAHGRRTRITKAQYLSAQLHHCGSKTEAGTCTGFVEKSGQFFALACLGILLGMLDNVQRTQDDLLHLLSGEVG